MLTLVHQGFHISFISSMKKYHAERHTILLTYTYIKWKKVVGCIRLVVTCFESRFVNGQSTLSERDRKETKQENITNTCFVNNSVLF